MRPAPTTWNIDPLELIVLALLLAGYLAVIGPLRHRLSIAEPVARRRIWSYVGGWATLALMLITPIDTLGRYYLFAAHSLQLFLIVTLAAPLLLYGLPEWLIARLLPLRALRQMTRGMFFTVVAATAFNGIILIWHIGPLYDAALRDTPLHELQMLCFLVAGLLTWWPLVTPLDRHLRLASPAQIFYLLLESLPLDIFGITAMFSPYVFYSTYANAPRLFSLLPPITDQQVSGGLLVVPGNLLDILLMSIVFFAWITRMESAQRAREHEQFAAEDAAEAAEGSEPAGVPLIRPADTVG
jgi:putative membrane protein